MANSLITIQLKLDALKIEVATPTVKSSGEAASTPSGATPKTTAQVSSSGSAPDLGLKEVRSQFNELAGDLKAASTSLQGLRDVVNALADVASALKSTADKPATTQASSGGEDFSGKIAASKARTEEIKKQIAAESESAAASAKNTEAKNEEAAASKKSADASEENAQAKGEEASAYDKAASGVDGNIKALAEIQAKWVATTAVNKDASSSLDEYARVAKASSVEGLNLSKTVGNQTSKVAQALKSFIPVGLDKDFRAQGEALKATGAIFASFSKITDAAAPAVQRLKEELASFTRDAAAEIKGGQDPTDVRRRVQARSERAVERFEGSSAGGQVKLKTQERNVAIAAAAFAQRVDRLQEVLGKLNAAIENGADEAEKAPFVDAFNNIITDLQDLSAKSLRLKGKASPFEAIPTAGGATEFSVADKIAASVEAAPLKRALTGFQEQLIQSVNTSIKTNEASKVLQEAFRKLATNSELGNIEENLRVLRETLATQGNIPVGGTERGGIAQQVQGGLNAKIDAGGSFTTPTGVGGDASFEFLNLNIAKFKKEAADALTVGQSLSKVFTFTDATGNVRKIQGTVKQLGSTLKDVRFQAQEVSKDLFNRVTVRAALSRVATWGAAAGIVFGAINAFKGAVRTIVDTESQVVRLAKVMNESRVNMDEFSKSAIETGLNIAQQFGQPLEDVLETMITFGQQGLNFEEVTQGTKAAGLASVVTTLNQPQAADALTAATEQFGLEFSDAISIVDKFNNVANNAAVTETVLAEALKKAGIAASNAGVDLDQFNGIVAAIAEQTRQSGNEVGTALRFIFSRINTEAAENGLAKIGVNVKDAEGNLRPFVQVITDLKERFGSLTKAQQTQAAISVAGTRRFNTLLALLKNFDTFESSLSNSINSAGTSLEQQGLVAETTAFKITQLKNSAVEAALSFGGVLAPALETSTEIARGFFEIISSLPTALQGTIVALGASGIAFAKFSQTFVNLGTAALPGGEGIVKTLTGSLTRGQTQANIATSAPAEAANIANLAGGGGQAVFAARNIGDFAKSTAAADTFTQAIKNSGRALVDVNGQQVKNVQNLTKFTAVTRGYKTVAADASGVAIKGAQATNLGLLTLNTTTGKVAASLVGLSTRFLKAIPLLGTGINKFADGLQQSDSGLLRLSGSLLKVGAAAAGLLIAFKLIGKFADFVTSDGESVAAGLQSEVAKRQEAINLLAKNKTAVEGVIAARRELSRLEVTAVEQPKAIRDEAIRRGDFKSPRLERQRIDQQQREVDNQLGTANPQLIESFDEFGNAILRTSAAFDKLAASASTAEERLLAATKVEIALAFLDDVTETDGAIKRATNSVLDFVNVFGVLDSAVDATRGTGTKFQDALEAFNAIGKDRITDDGILIDGDAEKRLIEQANRLGVPLSSLNEELDSSLKKLVENVNKTSGPVRQAFAQFSKNLSDLPLDTFASQIDEIVPRLERLTALQGAELGRPVTESALIASNLLRNASAAGPIRKFVGSGTTGQDTKAALNEAGFLEAAVEIGENTRKTVNESFNAGDVLIFDDQQVIVQVDAFGERVTQVFNETTKNLDTVNLADLIDATGVPTVAKFVGESLKKQISQSLIELTRTPTGAGRGIIAPAKVDLGADRGFDLSAQDRVANTSEPLIQDLVEAQRALTTARTEFKAQLESGDIGAIAFTQAANIAELSSEFDKLATVTKFKTKLEEVSAAFEKATDALDKNIIAQKTASEFDGRFGALRGSATQKFTSPLERRDLSAQQIANVDNPELTIALNRISQSEINAGQDVARAEQTAREIGILVSDFQAATSAGGATDPEAFSASLERILDEADKSEAEKLQSALARQNDIGEAQHVTLKNILTAIELDGEEGAERTAVVLTDALKTGNIGAEKAASTVQAFTPEQLTSLSTDAVSRLAGQLKEATPDNLRTEVASRRAEQELSIFQNALLTGTTSTSGQSEALGAIEESTASREAAREAAQTRKDTTKFFQENPNALGADAFLEEASKFSRVTDALAATVTSIQGQGTGADLSDDKLDEIASLIADQDKTISSRIEGIRDDGGDEGVRDLIRQLINDVSTPVESLTAPEPERPPIDVVAQGQEARKSAEDRAARRRSQLNSDLNKENKATGKSLEELRVSVAKTEVAFREGLGGAIDKIVGQAELFKVGGAGVQTGALAGTQSLTLDLGKSLADLTGADVTQRDSQDIIQSANARQELIQGLATTFQSLQADRGRAERDLEGATRTGDPAAITAASTNLERLTDTLGLLGSRIQTTTDDSRKLAETLQNLNSINQFKQDIDGLFKSFDQERNLQFDRTSIESALGNNVFSQLRPTFEQFEQGQKGFATAFERAIADIDFQESAGTITSEEADRLTSKAEFDRDEGVIQVAQEKENRSLQIEISAAEQIRKRLLEFSTSGGTGAGEAKALFDQLTSRLETAGDISASGRGTQTVRDPNTGREVDVPASSILQFKGVEGLDGLQSAVGKLAQAAKQEESAKSAALVAEPIVTSMDAFHIENVQNLGEIKDLIAAQTPHLENIDGALDDQAKVGDKLSQAEGVTSTAGRNRLLSDVDRDVTRSVEDRGRGAVERAAESTTVGSEGASVVDSLLEAWQSAKRGEITTSQLALSALKTLTEGLSKVNVQLTEAEQNFANFQEFLKQNPGLESGGAQKFATGGMIFGPGGPKADRIPILASAGEFVVNAAAVQKFGADNLSKINSAGATGKSDGFRFQDGGETDRDRILNEDDERLANELLQRGTPTGNERNDNLRRGKEVRFDGPTGVTKFESDVFAENLQDLEQQIESAPSNADVRDRVKGLRADERNRIANLAEDKKRRLNISAGELRGAHHMSVLPDGTIKFRANPFNGSVRVGSADTKNIDISSRKAFLADIKDRKSRKSRINKIPEETTDKEEIRQARRSLLLEEESRIEQADEEIGALDAYTRHNSSISDSDQDFTSGVITAYNAVQNIKEKLDTPSGRTVLRQEKDTVLESLGRARSDLSFWTSQIQEANHEFFRFIGPDGIPVGDPQSLYLAGDTTLSPKTGISLGGTAYPESALLQEVLTGSFFEDAKAVDAQLDGRFFGRTVKGGLDTLLSGDTGTFLDDNGRLARTIKISTALAAGPGQAIENTVVGGFGLVAAGSQGIEDIIKGDKSITSIPGGVVDAGSAIVDGTISTVQNVGTTSKAFFDSARNGEDFDQSISKLADVSTAVTEAGALIIPAGGGLLKLTTKSGRQAALNSAKQGFSNAKNFITDNRVRTAFNKRFGSTIDEALENSTPKAVLDDVAPRGLDLDDVVDAPPPPQGVRGGTALDDATAAQKQLDELILQEANLKGVTVDDLLRDQPDIAAVAAESASATTPGRIRRLITFIKDSKTVRFSDDVIQQGGPIPGGRPFAQKFQSRRGKAGSEAFDEFDLGQPAGLDLQIDTTPLPGAPPATTPTPAATRAAAEAAAPVRPTVTQARLDELVPSVRPNDLVRQSVGTEITSFRGLPNRTPAILPNQLGTGAFNPFARGGTSQANTGLRGFFNRKVDEFRLSRELSSNLDSASLGAGTSAPSALVERAQRAALPKPIDPLVDASRKFNIPLTDLKRAGVTVEAAKRAVSLGKRDKNAFIKSVNEELRRSQNRGSFLAKRAEDFERQPFTPSGAKPATPDSGLLKEVQQRISGDFPTGPNARTGVFTQEQLSRGAPSAARRPTDLPRDVRARPGAVAPTSLSEGQLSNLTGFKDPVLAKNALKDAGATTESALKALESADSVKAFRGEIRRELASRASRRAGDAEFIKKGQRRQASKGLKSQEQLAKETRARLAKELAGDISESQSRAIAARGTPRLPGSSQPLPPVKTPVLAPGVARRRRAQAKIDEARRNATAEKTKSNNAILDELGGEGTAAILKDTPFRKSFFEDASKGVDTKTLKQIVEQEKLAVNLSRRQGPISPSGNNPALSTTELVELRRVQQGRPSFQTELDRFTAERAAASTKPAAQAAGEIGGPDFKAQRQVTPESAAAREAQRAKNLREGIAARKREVENAKLLDEVAQQNAGAGIGVADAAVGDLAKTGRGVALPTPAAPRPPILPPGPTPAPPILPRQGGVTQARASGQPAKQPVLQKTITDVEDASRAASAADLSKRLSAARQAKRIDDVIAAEDAAQLAKNISAGRLAGRVDDTILGENLGLKLLSQNEAKAAAATAARRAETAARQVSRFEKEALLSDQGFNVITTTRGRSKFQAPKNGASFVDATGKRIKVKPNQFLSEENAIRAATQKAKKRANFEEGQALLAASRAERAASITPITSRLGPAGRTQRFDPGELVKSPVNRPKVPASQRPGADVRTNLEKEIDDLFEAQGIRTSASPRGFANGGFTGGRITGPGGPKSDIIPILASNGEFVINAATVSKLGVPFFDAINNGGQPSGGKFQDGGLVGGTGSLPAAPSAMSPTRVDVNVNTDDVSNSISKAITSAFESIELPPLDVNTEGVSVPVDVPSAGIPLDTSGVSLGDNLGSGVRDRLEQVEGTIEGLLTDSNSIQDALESIDLSGLESLTNDVSDIKGKLPPIEEAVLNIDIKLSTQKDQILTEAFTLVTEQINNIDIENPINSTIAKLTSTTNEQITELTRSVASAVSVADSALAQALARA